MRLGAAHDNLDAGNPSEHELRIGGHAAGYRDDLTCQALGPVAPGDELDAVAFVKSRGGPRAPPVEKRLARIRRRAQDVTLHVELSACPRPGMCGRQRIGERRPLLDSLLVAGHGDRQLRAMAAGREPDRQRARGCGREHQGGLRSPVHVLELSVRPRRIRSCRAADRRRGAARRPG